MDETRARVKPKSGAAAVLLIVLDDEKQNTNKLKVTCNNLPAPPLSRAFHLFEIRSDRLKVRARVDLIGPKLG